MPTPGNKRKTVPLGLRRADQMALWGLVVAASVVIGLWCVHEEFFGGGTIDIDRAAPDPALFTLDINTAEQPELELLPGVGETLARRIIDSREQAGPFVDHEDLRRITGIGPLTLERMRPHLRPMPRLEGTAGQGGTLQKEPTDGTVGS